MDRIGSSLALHARTADKPGQSCLLWHVCHGHWPAQMLFDLRLAAGLSQCRPLTLHACGKMQASRVRIRHQWRQHVHKVLLGVILMGSACRNVCQYLQQGFTCQVAAPWSVVVAALVPGWQLLPPQQHHSSLLWCVDGLQ